MKKGILAVIIIVIIIFIAGAGAFFFLQTDLNKARQIALEQVGDDQAKIVEEKVEKDFLLSEYEFTIQTDTEKFEVQISGFGQVSSFERETLPSYPQNNQTNDFCPNNSQTANTDGSNIGLEKAQQIALQQHPNGSVKGIDTDHEYGKLIYEIEVIEDQTEYDYTIDAATGEILHTKQESIYD